MYIIIIIIIIMSITLIPTPLSTWNSILYVREEITAMLFSLFKFTLALNSVRLFWKLLAFVSLLGTSETFLCSTFALQLKTVLLLDVLQLLMLSVGTLMSLEIIIFPLNTFYCEQDTVCISSIYLIVYVHKGKAVPLHAMEALGGRGGIAPTHSRPRH
jgi:hypothetical protein